MSNASSMLRGCPLRTIGKEKCRERKVVQRETRLRGAPIVATEFLTSKDRGILSIGTSAHLSSRPVARLPAAGEDVGVRKQASISALVSAPFQRNRVKNL